MRISFRPNFPTFFEEATFPSRNVPFVFGSVPISGRGSYPRISLLQNSYAGLAIPRHVVDVRVPRDHRARTNASFLFRFQSIFAMSVPPESNEFLPRPEDKGFDRKPANPADIIPTKSTAGFGPTDDSISTLKSRLSPAYVIQREREREYGQGARKLGSRASSESHGKIASTLRLQPRGHTYERHAGARCIMEGPATFILAR